MKCPGALDFAEVTEDDVLQAIKSLKPSKATDIYGISPFVIKIAGPIIALPLMLITNTSLLEGNVPEEWKKAKVIPVHKKGSRKNIANYRPISILPAFSKILELLVKRQLTEQLEATGVLPPSQHGFRARRSTITAMATFEQDVKTALQQGKKAGALFLDLSAAFDMIDVDIIARRLKTYGASERVCSWMRSYLTGRKQAVYYQGESSPMIDNNIGAPQGSVISPLLFLVLVADMEKAIDDIPGVSLMSYADDTTIIAVAENSEEVRLALEKGADKIFKYMSNSGLVANPEKTHFMMFCRDPQAPIRVGNSDIPESSSEKLVGFTIKKDLSWKLHTEELEKALRGRIGVLRRLSWHLPTSTLVSCLNPLFTSKLQYGLELVTQPLMHLSPNSPKCTVIQKLQVLQNEAMRTVLHKRLADKVSEKDLLKKCGQHSVAVLSLRATNNQAWNFLGSSERRSGFELQHRLCNWKQDRPTRQNSGDSFPEQLVKNSLLSRITKCWNQLPIDIKSARSKKVANAKIKAMFV